jgi:hypothetical protein
MVQYAGPATSIPTEPRRRPSMIGCELTRCPALVAAPLPHGNRTGVPLAPTGRDSRGKEGSWFTIP